MQIVAVIDGMKPCSKCGGTLPVAAFQRSAWTKSGYRSACRQCRAAENAADYAANRTERLQAGAVWRERNAQRMRDARAAWLRANPERFKAAVKDWGRRNPDARRAHTRNYRARKRAAPGSHTKADVAFLRAAQKGRCVACRERLGAAFHVDHVVALASGGSNDRGNLQLLCGLCNRRKSDKDSARFMREQGYLL